MRASQTQLFVYAINGLLSVPLFTLSKAVRSHPPLTWVKTPKNPSAALVLRLEMSTQRISSDVPVQCEKTLIGLVISVIVMCDLHKMLDITMCIY